MSHTTAIRHHPSLEHERTPYRRLFLAVLLALVIGALGLAIETRINVAAADLSIEAPATTPLPTFPARELPKEWRWQREAVQFEHMYRKDPTPKLDWIR